MSYALGTTTTERVYSVHNVLSTPLLKVQRSQLVTEEGSCIGSRSLFEVCSQAFYDLLCNSAIHDLLTELSDSCFLEEWSKGYWEYFRPEVGNLCLAGLFNVAHFSWSILLLTHILTSKLLDVYVHMLL